jgi:hypothetical protein
MWPLLARSVRFRGSPVPVSISDITKLIDIRKLPPHVWAGVALASAFVLFCPDDLAARLGADGLRAAHRPLLGGALVVCSTVLASMMLGWAWQTTVSTLQIRKAMRDLHRLPPDQKRVLRLYIERDVSTGHFELQDGVARGLEAQGLIFRASDTGNVLTGFPFNIQPWVREYLKTHPEVFDGLPREPKR